MSERLASHVSDMSLRNNKEDLLFWAASTGQQELLQNCLAQKTHNINRRGQRGRTAVMEAALQGQQTSFELLVSAGADLTVTDEDGDSCLILAAEGGNGSIVKELLVPDRKQDINFCGQNGRSAIMIAALKGDLFIYKLLTAAGADVSLCDADGNNCLHLAAKGGNARIVKILMEIRSFDINVRGHAGQTPLMMASFEGKREVFDLLVSKGADLSLLDSNNNDCLMIAVFSGDTSMLKKVLETGKFDVNRKGEKGMTPAMMAASFGAKDDFDLLVSAGADLTLRNNFENDFLFWAASGGNPDIVKHLLSLELFDINRKQEHGLTPLHIAITRGNVKVFELLVSEGADVSLCNDQQYNSLMIAAHTGNSQIVKLLLTIKSTDISSREENGWTPLMIAAKCGHTEVFDILASKGGDMLLQDKDSNNCLVLASIYSQPLMVQHLLSMNKYDINSRGMYSWTPLMTAVNEGHNDVFDVLVAAGADVTLQDERKNNCLILACMGGDAYIVKKLLAMRVFDLEYEGLDGSAVAAAAREGHTGILELLVQAGAKLPGVDDAE